MDWRGQFWTDFGEMGLNLGEEVTEHLGHRGRVDFEHEEAFFHGEGANPIWAEAYQWLKAVFRAGMALSSS